jgi:hypothetical protein
MAAAGELLNDARDVQGLKGKALTKGNKNIMKKILVLMMMVLPTRTTATAGAGVSPCSECESVEAKALWWPKTGRWSTFARTNRQHHDCLCSRLGNQIRMRSAVLSPSWH